MAMALSRQAYDSRLFGSPDPAFYPRKRFVAQVERSSGVAVDVGCGNAYFLRRLEGLGYRGLGIDLIASNVDRLGRRWETLEFACGRATSLPVRTSSVDAVLCFEVLEHVRDDRAVLREIVRVMRQSAHVYLSTPNGSSSVSPRGESISEEEDGGHVRYGYTISRLREMCDDSGLQVLEIRYANGRAACAATTLARLASRPLGVVGSAMVAMLLGPPVALFERLVPPSSDKSYTVFVKASKVKGC